jgi:predicted RNA-binding protein with PIN domain
VPYLIDGNNLLGSWGGVAVPGDARAEVVRRVAAFCRARGARATLVFDGAPLRVDVKEQQLGAVSIRFPPPGRDADSVIRDLVDSAARPADLIVVTSDRPLYSYARTRGASVLRAHEWNALARGQRLPTRRKSVAAASNKPEHEADVEGWLRRFSRDQKD